VRVRRLALIVRRYVRSSRLLQIGLILGFWLVGEGVVRLTRVPIPGGIVGMAIVLVLLASGLVRLGSVRLGAEWFLAQMLLFFVPAVLAVLDHREFLGWVGLKVLAVIFFGTVLVMGVTALAVDLCCRWGGERGGGDDRDLG